METENARESPEPSESRETSAALTRRDHPPKLIQRVREHLASIKETLIKKFASQGAEQTGPPAKEDESGEDDYDLEFLQQQLQLYGVSVPAGLDMRLSFKWRPRLESIVEFQDQTASPKFLRSNSSAARLPGLDLDVRRKLSERGRDAAASRPCAGPPV